MGAATRTERDADSRGRETDRQRGRLILFVIITNANNERFCMATGTGSRQLGANQTDLNESSRETAYQTLSQNKHVSPFSLSLIPCPTPSLAPVKAQQEQQPQQPPKKEMSVQRDIHQNM